MMWWQKWWWVVSIIGLIALLITAAVGDRRVAARCDTTCLPYAARVTSDVCYCARPDGTWAKKEPTP